MLSAFWAVALVISSLWASVIGLRMPVPEIRMLKKKDLEIEDSSAKNSLLEKKDLVCLEDDYLLSLQMFPDDSIPSCSSYLGIQDVISTAFVKARTTVTALVTVEQTFGGVTTIPSGTTTITTTVRDSQITPQLMRRQDSADSSGAMITPAASLIAACDTGLNASLISAVSSACSCLTITPAVSVISITSTSTRIISGVDYEQKTVPSTVFGPSSTVTVTVKPTSFNHNTTTPASSTGLISCSSTSSSQNISSIPSTSSTTSTFGPSTTTYPITSTSMPVPPSTSASPSPSMNITTTSAGPGSSVVPPRSLNSTSSLGTSTSSFIPSSSGIPSIPSNSTSAPPASTSLPPLQHCPIDNGTTYTTQGQTFLIECYTDYTGPTLQGLQEPDLYDCIIGCATVNVGFSQDRCYAASYYQNSAGPNCFFKTHATSLLPSFSGTTVSALLLNANVLNTTAISTTSTASGPVSISANSSISAGPTGSSSVNITSLPSITPSISLNSTSPSGTPHGPTNFTIPNPTESRLIPTHSGNHSCSACTPVTSYITYVSTSIITMLPM